MNTKHILSRSVATLLVLVPFAVRAAVDTLTGTGAAVTTGVSWAAPVSPSAWSLGTLPGVSDNAVISATGFVDIRGSAAAFGATHSTEIQDLTFNSTAAVTLNNNSTTQPMLLILNGGRGAGVPLISTVGDFLYTITGPGTGAPAFPLSLQLKASGDISVAANILAISAVIGESGGARSITKTGAGRLTLSVANTFTGGATVLAGILEVTNNSALGSGATVVGGGTLEVNIPSATLTSSVIIVGAGGQIATRGAVTLNNAITLSGGTLATRSTDTDNYAGAINVTANSFVALKSYTTQVNSQSINISGQLTGSGSLDLSGNNTGGNGEIGRAHV